jgi:hypothetical protein
MLYTFWAFSATKRAGCRKRQLTWPKPLSCIPLGALDQSWPSAEEFTLTPIQAVGNTAIFRVEAILKPEAVVPTLRFQFTAEELQRFLTEPDREDPRFRPFRSQLGFYEPLPEGRLRAVMEVTLYRQAQGWRVELARLQPLNTEVLYEPIKLAEEAQPFQLTGTVRLLNRKEGWIGVNLEKVSPSLERYAGTWVSVVPAEEVQVTRLGRSASWLELRPGDEVEMEGKVRFAVNADAKGRIPAAIRAERIRVVQAASSSP